MTDELSTFAASFAALYAAHHVGDYWVQTHHQAMHKGDHGTEGRVACTLHVLTYLLTQALFLAALSLVLDMPVTYWGMGLALLVSGVTHYTADRREYGLLFKLARAMPWKVGFLRLGVPRAGHDDNPCLGTGAAALDQSWHIPLGAFVPALIIAAFA